MSGSDSSYWAARARELQRELDGLRARMIALVDALPFEMLELLELDLETLKRATWHQCSISGIEECHTLIPSDVETELRLAWQRVGRARIPDD